MVVVVVQVILGRAHVVSSTSADKLDPVVTADCHVSCVTVSPSHSHAIQTIHSQVNINHVHLSLTSQSAGSPWHPFGLLIEMSAAVSLHVSTK